MTTYPEVLSALRPEDRASVETSVMRLRVYGGVGGVGGAGCAPGVGSWLSQAARSIARPIANVVAPGNPVTLGLNTFFPDAPAPAPAPAPAAREERRDYGPMILFGVLGVGALFLIARKR